MFEVKALIKTVSMKFLSMIIQYTTNQSSKKNYLKFIK